MIPEFAPVTLRAHHESRAPQPPLPGADQAITLGGPPGGAQHQQQGDLGGVQMRGVT